MAPGVFTAADMKKDGSSPAASCWRRTRNGRESDTAKTGRDYEGQLVTALNAALPQTAAGGRPWQRPLRRQTRTPDAVYRRWARDGGAAGCGPANREAAQGS